MTINEIKNILENTETERLLEVLKEFESDERVGVKKVVGYYKRWYNKICADKERLEGMLFFERKYEAMGYICGCDEAGVGPLAGPVSAAAVILPAGCIIEGLRDSKKISEKRREELYHAIREKAISYAVAFVENDEIDALNILQARLKAMALAINKLEQKPNFVLIDGNFAPKIDIGHVCITDGDANSVSIAAASILAKVERDYVMRDYHKLYPQYGFDQHKGYGTDEHIAAIKEFGLTPIHRKTFLSGLKGL